MTHFVQIVNEFEQKAVRFAFNTQTKADMFARVLNQAMQDHKVDGVVGTYKAGERCPYGFGSTQP